MSSSIDVTTLHSYDTAQNSDLDPTSAAVAPLSSETQAEVKKFEEIVKAESKALFSARTVFPIDIFPSEVIIDKTKVTIIKKYFFWTRQVTTILIPDILNVQVNQGLVFAALEIVDRYFAQEPFHINYFWKPDATKLASVIQGLVLALKEDINIMKIPNETLMTHAESAGFPEKGKKETA